MWHHENPKVISLILKPFLLGSTQGDDLQNIVDISSFNTFKVIIIKSHKQVNNHAADLTLASFKKNHLVKVCGSYLS